jgi:hypothetical protein
MALAHQLMPRPEVIELPAAGFVSRIMSAFTPSVAQLGPQTSAAGNKMERG